MATILDYINEIMGARAGDGLSPVQAAEAVNARFDTSYSPRQVWNLWIDGETD